MNRLRPLAGALPVFALLAALGCASDSRPDPRETVKGFFAAIRESDSLYLSQHIDMKLAAPTLGEELRSDTSIPDESRGLLSALTGEGRLRKRWLENQIVLGRAQESGDTAWVEVSFIDPLTRVQYYNKMCLDFRRDHWVINSFRTL